MFQPRMSLFDDVDVAQRLPDKKTKDTLLDIESVRSLLAGLTAIVSVYGRR